MRGLRSESGRTPTGHTESGSSNVTLTIGPKLLVAIPAELYKVITHVVVGSNDPAAAGKPVIGKTAKAIDQVRPDFEYSDYRLVTNHFQTFGNGGSVTFESILSSIGSLKGDENPIFTDWIYGGFRINENPAGTLSLKNFRFQARVPVVFRGLELESGRPSVVKYEVLKLSLNNLEMEFNKPVAIASLLMPLNGESLFFILEVRKV